MGDRLQALLVSLMALIALTAPLLVWYLCMFGYTHKYDAFVRRPVSPYRIVAAVVVPITLITQCLKSKDFTLTSAVIALIVTSMMTLINYCFLAALLTYFAVGSCASSIRTKGAGGLQRSFYDAIADGVTWWAGELHILGSCALASELALVYYLESGSAELPVDFVRSYESSWFSTALLGAIAGLTGDACATQLGLAFSTERPRLITTWTHTPYGTHGGVSAAGTAGSALGGFLVGLVYYAAVCLFAERHVLESSPPQYPLLLLGTASGVLGSAVDSILGATVQFTGYNYETKTVVETPGPYVFRVAGTAVLDNVGVDMVSSFVTSLIVPHMAWRIWERFV